MSSEYSPPQSQRSCITTVQDPSLLTARFSCGVPCGISRHRRPRRHPRRTAFSAGPAPTRANVVFTHSFRHTNMLHPSPQCPRSEILKSFASCQPHYRLMHLGVCERLGSPAPTISFTFCAPCLAEIHVSRGPRVRPDTNHGDTILNAYAARRGEEQLAGVCSVRVIDN